MKTMPRLIIIMLLLSVYLYADEVDLEQELSNKISVDLEGMSFEKALGKISAQTKIEIIPLGSILQNNRLVNEKIHLDINEMPMWQLIDWLARAIGGKYKVFPDGRVYLSENYEWVESNRFGMLFLDLTDVVSGAQELQDLDKNIGEFTKIITLFDDNYYVRLEEQDNAIKLVAHTPKELKPIFENLIKMYRHAGEDIRSIRPAPREDFESFIKKLYKVKKIDYPYLPLNTIIKKLGVDFNVNIGFNGAPFELASKMPQLSLKLGSVTLKEAVESIVEKTNFKGVEISLPNGLWLTRYSASWDEAVSREFLWSDNIRLRSYNVGSLTTVMPGEIIVEQLIKNVAPRAWLDPLASLIYNPKNNCVIVLAGENTQNRVLLSLNDLIERVSGIE